MADELKHIEVLYGSSRMQVLAVPAAEADAAIAAGWAWDMSIMPIAPEPLADNEARAAMVEAADAAVDKWRLGETAGGPPITRGSKPAPKADDEHGSYKTRDEQAEKRGPGRPPHHK